MNATLELGTKPVGRLLWQYALPAIIAMVAASLYNIIDRAFIGQIVGPEAIAGLAITFPLMNLAAAFGAGVGIGSSTSISVKFGQKDYDTAELLLGNTVTLNLLIGISFAVIALLFLDPILLFFGASHATLPYARAFMQVILLGNPISHMYFGMNAVLRAAGKPKHAMYATLFTVGMNIVLDVVFIRLFGWGIRGAALGTVISQLMALCWQMTLFTRDGEVLQLRRGIYRLHWNLVRLIIGIGISPFLMNACACFVVILVNKQLVTYGGDMAVGAYGIANAVGMVFVLIVIGLNQGMQPIAGYNFGARKSERLFGVLRLAMISATCITTTGWLLSIFIPEYLARIFTADPTLVNMGAEGIGILMRAYPIIGVQMVTTFFFQCIGKVKVSIFLSLSRQLIFLVPFLLVLPLHFHIDGVWAAMPASDTIACLMAIAMILYHAPRLRQQLQ